MSWARRPILNAFRRTLMLTLLGFAGLQCPSPVMGQTATLVAGHLLDPASGETTTNQLIRVVDGKIASIEPAKDVSALEPGWIDLRDSWVLPGLMDAHVHITWNIDYHRPNWNDTYLNEGKGLRALRGVKVAQEFLRAGFTTIKEIGNDLDYATADVIRAIKAGWYEGPHIQYAGMIIAPFGGQTGGITYDNKGFWQIDFIDADSPEEIVKAIRQNIYFGADTIKLVSDQQRYFYSQQEIEAAVAEAKRSGLKVTVHVMGGEAARAVILGGAAAIEHGFDLDEELLRLMKEHGTFLVGTDFAFANFKAYGMSDDAARANSDKLVRRLRLAHQLGVKLAFGTDIVIDLPDKNRIDSSLEVLQTWQRAEIPNLEILRAMTCNAAELMDLDERVGRVIPGWQADLIALPGNPLEDINHIRSVHFVMRNGRVFRHDVN